MSGQTDWFATFDTFNLSSYFTLTIHIVLLFLIVMLSFSPHPSRVNFGPIKTKYQKRLWQKLSSAKSHPLSSAMHSAWSCFVAGYPSLPPSLPPSRNKRFDKRLKLGHPVKSVLCSSAYDCNTNIHRGISWSISLAVNYWKVCNTKKDTLHKLCSISYAITLFSNFR